MAIEAVNKPQILKATVMHSRKATREDSRENSFAYNILFLRLPIELLNKAKGGFLFGLNKFGILSVSRKDHGTRKDVSPRVWLECILDQLPNRDEISTIQLLTLPRVLGYAFKPVSFWFCLDDQQQPIAVVAEVNNTFGETHSYLCSNADGQPISAGDTLTADKLFHVSPFIQRDGYYEFKFTYKPQTVLVGINHFNAEGELRLITFLKCQALPETGAKLKTLIQGLGSLSVFPLILWQAMKIWVKGIAYVPKPKQRETRVSTTRLK